MPDNEPIVGMDLGDMDDKAVKIIMEGGQNGASKRSSATSLASKASAALSTGISPIVKPRFPILKM